MKKIILALFLVGMIKGAIYSSRTTNIQTFPSSQQLDNIIRNGDIYGLRRTIDTVIRSPSVPCASRIAYLSDLSLKLRNGIEENKKNYFLVKESSDKAKSQISLYESMISDLQTEIASINVAGLVSSIQYSQSQLRSSLNLKTTKETELRRNRDELSDLSDQIINFKKLIERENQIILELEKKSVIIQGYANEISRELNDLDPQEQRDLIEKYQRQLEKRLAQIQLIQQNLLYHQNLAYKYKNLLSQSNFRKTDLQTIIEQDQDHIQQVTAHIETIQRNLANMQSQLPVLQNKVSQINDKINALRQAIMREQQNVDDAGLYALQKMMDDLKMMSNYLDNNMWTFKSSCR